MFFFSFLVGVTIFVHFLKRTRDVEKGICVHKEKGFLLELLMVVRFALHTYMYIRQYLFRFILPCTYVPNWLYMHMKRSFSTNLIIIGINSTLGNSPIMPSIARAAFRWTLSQTGIGVRKLVREVKVVVAFKLI